MACLEFWGCLCSRSFQNLLRASLAENSPSLFKLLLNILGFLVYFFLFNAHVLGSFISWGAQAFYTTSLVPFNATLTPWMSIVYQVQPSVQNFAWVQVLVYGIVFRLFAWLALVYKEQ